jgi:HSP20 family protein
MAALIRWNPVRTMTLSDAMERLLADRWVRPAVASDWAAVDTLALDMYETDDAYVVKAPVPGVKPEDVDVHIEDGVLTLRGETKREENVENARYHWQERWYGQFERSVRLPSQVDASKVEANLKEGILTISVPKAEEIKPKKIDVKVE